MPHFFAVFLIALWIIIVLLVAFRTIMKILRRSDAVNPGQTIVDSEPTASLTVSPSGTPGAEEIGLLIDPNKDQLRAALLNLKASDARVRFKMTSQDAQHCRLATAKFGDRSEILVQIDGRTDWISCDKRRRVAFRDLRVAA